MNKWSVQRVLIFSVKEDCYAFPIVCSSCRDDRSVVLLDVYPDVSDINTCETIDQRIETAGFRGDHDYVVRFAE